MTNALEARRRGLIKSFETRKPDLLWDLQEDFGGVVQDLRLHGSVLDPTRFTEDSDVDVAVIVSEPNAAPWIRKLHKALFGGGYPLQVSYRGERIQLDAITMCEADWPTWSRGKTKTERGL